MLTFDELAAKSSVTTLSGDTLTVSNDGGTVTVNGAVVSAPKSDSVSGEEGQEVSVLGIDTVLLDSPVSGPSPAVATARRSTATAAGSVLIEVRGVTKDFGEQRALDEVDLTIPAGVVVGLIGPSGCGKTTLIRIADGHLATDRGRRCGSSDQTRPASAPGSADGSATCRSCPCSSPT